VRAQGRDYSLPHGRHAGDVHDSGQGLQQHTEKDALGSTDKHRGTTIMGERRLGSILKLLEETWLKQVSAGNIHKSQTVE
jgi:hypothetical protein